MGIFGVNPNGWRNLPVFSHDFIRKFANVLLKQRMFSVAVISAFTHTGGRKLAQLALESPSQ